MTNIGNKVKMQVANSRFEDVSLTNKNRIVDLLEKHKDQIKKALPSNQDVNRIIRIITTALSRNADLLKCDPVTILACAIESAQLGLVVDSFLGEAFFVPFYSSKRQRYEAQLIIGYKGYKQLAYRSGMIKKLYADVVREGDHFEYEYGSNEKLLHIPEKNIKAPIVGAYAYAITKDDGIHFVYLSKEEIEIYRAKSKSGENRDNVWTLNYEAMAKKTAIRRLATFLPLSPLLERATAIENLYDEGISPELDKEYELEEINFEEVKEEKNEPQKEKAKNPKKKEIKNDTEKPEAINIEPAEPTFSNPSNDIINEIFGDEQ